MCEGIFCVSMRHAYASTFFIVGKSLTLMGTSAPSGLETQVLSPGVVHVCSLFSRGIGNVYHFGYFSGND